mmetsp:Transcript_110727/g.298418  ORF Transcript_110727/g.298418 Transcript_110727/m.298418 type:complete len:117 (-) Transcript_110727:54-404(-)
MDSPSLVSKSPDRAAHDEAARPKSLGSKSPVDSPSLATKSLDRPEVFDAEVHEAKPPEVPLRPEYEDRDGRAVLEEEPPLDPNEVPRDPPLPSSATPRWPRPKLRNPCPNLARPTF